MDQVRPAPLAGPVRMPELLEPRGGKLLAWCPNHSYNNNSVILSVVWRNFAPNAVEGPAVPLADECKNLRATTLASRRNLTRQRDNKLLQHKLLWRFIAIIFGLLYAGKSGPVLAQTAPVINGPLTSARQLLEAGHYAAADEALRRVLLESPRSADAHFLLGFALLHEEKPAESLAEYTEGAKFGQPGADDLAAVASDYVLLKDFKDADHWLQAAVQRAPAKAQLWYLLGRTQYNENLWADAEHSFAQCLRLEPRHVRAEYNLGLVYEAEQRPALAEEAYRTAIRWENDPPQDTQPHLDWGILLRRQGKNAEALPLLTVAAQGTGANNPMAHQELALVLDNLGRTAEGIVEMKKAIALSPNIQALHFFLGRMFRKMGNAAEAGREFAEAARIAGTQSDEAVPNANLP